MSVRNVTRQPDGEKKQVNMDRGVSAVAYPVHTDNPGMPPVTPDHWPALIARQEYYRRVSSALPRGSDPVYLKPEDKTDTGQ
ncbi:hypothetical protein NMD07_25545 (plasmid) [Citrobacter cronae]|uniref:hypothetical protein n=1 Tax=Enterobacteriaceae TaxID=543 RepID=UPI002209EBE1|nr:hypothetical protein [Citrobacter freundii]